MLEPFNSAFKHYHVIFVTFLAPLCPGDISRNAYEITRPIPLVRRYLHSVLDAIVVYENGCLDFELGAPTTCLSFLAHLKD